jgi:hypothetical protein
MVPSSSDSLSIGAKLAEFVTEKCGEAVTEVVKIEFDARGVRRWLT